jgi:hypothetical protein
MDSSSARALVEQIALDHGHIDEEDLSKLAPDLQRKIKYALRRKDSMIGSSVITYDQWPPRSLSYPANNLSIT